MNDAQAWLSALQQAYPQVNQDLLLQAYLLVEAQNGYATVPFANNALQQGKDMVEILCELGADSSVLTAALVYPCMYYQQLDKTKIFDTLGGNVVKLIGGAERMEAIQDMYMRDAQADPEHSCADNLRKMLLAIVDDIRIVALKLAERLTMLRHLKYCALEEQQSVAQLTLDLYAPLANRLGIGQLKWQLEDLSFRYLNPKEYQRISKALNMRRADREEFIQEIIARLQTLFTQENIQEVELSGRAKHIYSIYRKVQRKQVDIDKIFDASAVRVLVPSVENCYQALSIVHTQWPHIASEFDDYIANPKPNGYKSIHTAVIGPNNINVEVQIRTHQMHAESELGIAAHWQYKEGSGERGYAEKINLLREMLDWQKEVSLESIFSDRIYVFTPKGDVFDLHAGATPIDFAYHVHTEIGHRCKGAKVNGKLVPLTYQLQTGDQISIVTSKENHPSRDWLNPDYGYVTTHEALNKVRSWFRRQAHAQHLEEGRALWDKAFRRANLHKNDIQKVVKQCNYNHIEDLYAALGSGHIGITAIINQIQALQHAPVEATESDAQESIRSAPLHKTSKSEFVIKGVDNVLTSLARCCKPIPGDTVLGYITKGRGITIHSIKCKNIQQIQLENPDRIVDVSWGDATPQAYPVDLSIIASDRTGLVRDISSVIADLKLSILGVNTHINKKQNEAYIDLTIEIKSLEPLNHVLSQLRQISGVTLVKRR